MSCVEMLIWIFTYLAVYRPFPKIPLVIRHNRKTSSGKTFYLVRIPASIRISNHRPRVIIQRVW